MNPAFARSLVPTAWCVALMLALPTGAIAGGFQRQSECPFAVATGSLRDRLECGYLDVPELHGQTASARLRLPVAIIRSTSHDPQPDPLVFIAGGPGAAPLESVRTVERFAQHPFGRDRDIIVYNQRGSPQTDPLLTCAALAGSRLAIHAADLTLAERDARIAATVVDCLGQLRSQGRILHAYGAAANAQDLKALRASLGVRQWNLLAVSYGTFMALEAVRADPDGVRSLVLDSVMSPESDLFMSEGPRNFALGLDRLLAACAEDAACAVAFPDLQGRLRSTIRSLDQRPVELRIGGVTDGESIAVTVNWHDFLSVVHWMLYNAKTLRLVPLLVDATSRGDLRLLATLMEYVYPASRLGAPGPSAAFFSVVCNDQFTVRNPLPTVPANADYRGFSIVSFMQQACEAAARGGERQAKPEPIRSGVPALLLSGRFDPMTPDVYAAALAALLENARMVVIDDSGHSTLSDFTACQTEVALRFIDSLETDRMHPCLTQERRPRFVLDVEEALEELGVRR
jgi:pimeloyl-ACP methyl ester carboxylesterase